MIGFKCLQIASGRSAAQVFLFNFTDNAYVHLSVSLALNLFQRQHRLLCLANLILLTTLTFRPRATRLRSTSLVRHLVCHLLSVNLTLSTTLTSHQLGKQWPLTLLKARVKQPQKSARSISLKATTHHHRVEQLTLTLIRRNNHGSDDLPQH